MTAFQFGGKKSIQARALVVGERFDLKAFERAPRLGLAPLIISAGKEGCAVLFRYGVAVLFNVEPLEEVAFLSQLKPLTSDPYPTPEMETEDLSLLSEKEIVPSVSENGDVADERGEGVRSGVIRLQEFSLERIQVVADTLAKSVILSHYEATIAGVFDRIEPVAVNLQHSGWGWPNDKELLQHIGSALLINHKMIGRVAISEKPELLWDFPALDRLHARLEDEYELRERQRLLEQKLELISRTVETGLELLQSFRNLRVEWYIVALIVFEIFLTLYQMFFTNSHP